MNGIVRRIDELGRVVIPKELRRTMQIRDGEELEITAENEGIIIRKYSQLKRINNVAEMYANVLYNSIRKELMIFDKDTITSHLGGVDNLVGEPISNSLLKAISDRHAKRLDKNIALIKGDNREYSQQYITPIVVKGDLFGGIVILGNLSQSDLTVIDVINNCFIAQLE